MIPDVLELVLNFAIDGALSGGSGGNRGVTATPLPPNTILTPCIELDEAYMESCDKLVHDPNDVSARMTHGVVCQSRGWLEDALKDFAIATRLAPNNVMAWTMVSEVLASLKQFDAARAAHLRATELEAAVPRA